MFVSPMHEDVHQRARQEQQIWKVWKGSKGVRRVLQEQIKGRHQEKTVEHPPRPAARRPVREEGEVSHGFRSWKAAWKQNIEPA